MNLYMKKIKSPDTLTIEEIQSISEKTKHTIRSYLEVSEEIKKVTELFRLILSANTEILLRKWITDISQEIDIKTMLDHLPYPTKDAMHQVLGKEFIDKDAISNI